MILINSKKKAPNLAIDMVKACLAHYKRWERPVDTITLCPQLFNRFKEGIEHKAGDALIYDRVEFKDVTVLKGSQFMVERMTVKLKERVLA